MHYQRHGEATIRKLASMFGAVLVTGARQVGKTTLLSEWGRRLRYVTLDDPILLASAVGQPGTFFKDNPPPVIVDEIQYAPNLFPQIKMAVDQGRKKGQFFLSGSQQFHMMRDIGESLAGRLGILNLPGLSLRERHAVAFAEPFLPTDRYFSARAKGAPAVSYAEIWETIHRGCMPELCANADYDWQMFYAAYVKTYLERDLRDLTQVADEVKFMQFMTVAAGRIGQLLNLASLAKDVGVSQPTAERWLSILVTSNLAYLLRPYHNNLTNRTVKTPKLYFLDTGLVAYLTRWNTTDVLKSGAMAGAFFENFVVAEVIKSYANQGILEPPLTFYRDRDGKEIDLLIEADGTLHPIEIKKHADPSREDVRSFSAIDRLSATPRGPGGVVCLYDRLATLQDRDKVIPAALL